MRWKFLGLVVALAVSGRAHALTTRVEVHTPALALGSLQLRDVSVSYRDRGKGHETCVRARLAKARVRACGVIAMQRGQVMLKNGHATLVLPPQGGVGTTTIEADVSGNLTSLDLSVRGTVKAPRATLQTRAVTATLTELALPFAVHVARAGGDLEITEDAPLDLHVRSATLAAAGTTIAVAPTVLLHAGWPRWSAEIRFRALDLAPAIRAATGGRVEATGSLSGRLALHGDGTEVTLAEGQAVARRGTLRLADRALAARLVAAVPAGKVAAKERVSAALADFSYSRLAVNVGGDPAVQLVIAGRGNRIPQQLDLTVNMRSKP